MTVLMTGLTGILGSVIGPALEESAFFLVRNGENNPRIPSGIDPERIIEGDITKPFCGVSPGNLDYLRKAGIDRFLHLAANVSFAVVDDNGDIWKDNFVGTQNALALAKELGVKEFLYCSTAFAPDKRNPYEKSKMAAEELVTRSGMKYDIFRPSAMVGDSETGYTADFNGYYGVYIYFHMLAEKARDENEKMIVPIPVYVVCSSASTINLITLDWVKHTMLALLKKPVSGAVYYLAHDNPPNVREVMSRGFDILGVSGVKYLEKPVSEEEKKGLYEGNDLPEIVRSRIDVILERYIPYVTFERKFSLETVKSALGGEFREPPAITDNLLVLLLSYAMEKNFGHLRRKRAGIKPQPQSGNFIHKTASVG